MADIDLVIKIPEEIRLALINNIQLSIDQQSICDSYIKQAIINGTPLDKIRTKVESIERYGTNNGKDLWLRTPEEIKEDVLNILDKYKEEGKK